MIFGKVFRGGEGRRREEERKPISGVGREGGGTNFTDATSCSCAHNNPLLENMAGAEGRTFVEEKGMGNWDKGKRE